jgi:hypothetical protein
MEENVMPASKTTEKQTAKAPAKKPAKKVTIDNDWFEKFQKGMEELRKSHEDFEKSHKKDMKEIWALHKETEEAHKETEKTLNKVIGDLGNKMGDMAEYMLVPNLPDKLQFYGFSFGKISRNVKLNDREHSIHAEIDVLLENGSQAMAVEVKVTLRPEDLEDHRERMEKIRRYADLHGDQRELYGAVAAMIIAGDVKKYALRQGFYVIEPSGEDITVTKPVSHPKVW